jgi:hypothetical protein
MNLRKTINIHQVEALGLIPEHLLNRLRGRDSLIDDVENPLQIMRQCIEDAKKGTNGRLPDNYRCVVEYSARLHIAHMAQAVLPGRRVRIVFIHDGVE